MAIEPIKLTVEDRRTLEDLKPDIAILEAELAKAERAGLDVATIKSDLAKAKTLLEGILREYAT